MLLREDSRFWITSFDYAAGERQLRSLLCGTTQDGPRRLPKFGHYGPKFGPAMPPSTGGEKSGYA
jgi:hypothetical protein